jgi:transposase
VLEDCGHEVLVANPRKTRLIYTNTRKTDEVDAENLARLARLDPKLLYPFKHRGEECQAHLTIIRSREALVSARTQLVNHIRGAVKSFGGRLPKCPARSFHNKAPEHIPAALWPALGPILETIGSLTQRIREYERQLETISKEHYPETELLRQVEGVGELTALTFVLTLYLLLFQHGRSPEWLKGRSDPKRSVPSNSRTMKPLNTCSAKRSVTKRSGLPETPEKLIGMGKSRLISRVYRTLYRASSI